MKKNVGQVSLAVMTHLTIPISNLGNKWWQNNVTVRHAGKKSWPSKEREMDPDPHEAALIIQCVPFCFIATRTQLVAGNFRVFNESHPSLQPSSILPKLLVSYYKRGYLRLVSKDNF